ncbi:MAG: class I SAM-dependent methyltransferase [Thiovulaceae bacterium]|nr:class I SAM-dependent methyltransferase [Sulfurimonadaceae bacterium]
MKERLKNLPFFGYLIQWFYNIFRINSLKQTMVIQQLQLNQLQLQFDQLQENVQILQGHNHLHHENYKQIQKSIEQHVRKQISYQSILFNQRIQQFIDKIEVSTFTQQKKEILQKTVLSFSLDDYYLSFEETFRGSQEVIKKRYEAYLQYLTPNIKSALDIGCGRGEWTQLLQENSIDASGIDLNSAMLNEGVSRGIKNLQNIDAFDFFKSCPDNSFDMVTAFHIIEHIPFEKLFLFLQELKRIVNPDGLILLETPNPQNLLVGAYTFYRDPTHLNPLPSEVVAFMLQYIGFEDIQTYFLHPYPEEEHIPENTQTAQRLNSYLYREQDYLIVVKNN